MKMSFILKKLRHFRDRQDEFTKLVQAVRKRSEFRMKNYISATESKAWSLGDEERKRIFLELLEGSPCDKAKVMNILTVLHEELEQNSVQLCNCGVKLGEKPVLEKKISGLQRELDESVIPAALSKEEYEECLEKLLPSQKKLKEELQTYYNELAKKQQEVEQLKSEVRRLKDVIQQKAEEKLTTDNNVKNLEQRPETLMHQETRPFRQNDLEGAKEENKKLLFQIDEHEIANMEQNLCECNEMRETKQQLQNLSNENSQPKKETAELKETITTLERKQPNEMNVSKVKEVSSMKATSKVAVPLEVLIQEMKKELEELQENFRNQSEVSSKLEKQLAEAREKTHEKPNEMRVSVHSANNTITALQELVKSYEQKLADKAGEREQLKAMLGELQMKLTMLENELMNEKYNSSLTRAVLTKSEIEHGIKDEKTEKLVNEKCRLEICVNKLTSEIKNLSSEIETLKKENAKCLEHEEENNKLKKKMQDLKFAGSSKIPGEEAMEQMVVAHSPSSEQLAKHVKDAEDTIKLQSEEIGKIRQQHSIKELHERLKLPTKEQKCPAEETLEPIVVSQSPEKVVKELNNAKDTITMQSEEIEKLRQQMEKLEAELSSTKSKVEKEIEEIITCYKCCGLFKEKSEKGLDSAGELQEKLKLAMEENRKLKNKILELNQSHEQHRMECGASMQENLTKQQEWEKETMELRQAKTKAENDRDKYKIEKQKETEARKKLETVIQELKAKLSEKPQKPAKKRQCDCKGEPKEAHKQKVQNLTNELNLRASQLDETLNKCLQEKQSLEESLKSLQEELEMLKGHASGVGKLENDLKSHKEQAELTAQQHTSELEAAQKENMELEHDIKDLQAKLLDCQNQLNDTNIHTDFQNQLDQKNTEIAKLGTLKGELEQTQKELGTKNAEIEKLKQQLDDMKKKYEDCQNQVSGHSETAGSLQKELEDMKKKYEDCQNQVSGHSETAGSLQKELEDMKKKYEDCQNQVSGHSETAGSLQKELEDMKKKYEDCQNQISGHSETAGSLQKELKDMKKKYEDCQNQISGHSETSGSLQKELEDCKSKLKNCEDEKKQMSEGMQKLKALQEQVEKLNRKNKDLQGTIGDMKTKHKDEISGMQSTIKKMNGGKTEDLIAKMKEDFKKQMDAKEKQCKENIKKVQKQHDKKIEEMGTRHQSELKAAKEQSKVENLSQLFVSKVQTHTLSPPEVTTAESGFSAILKKLLEEGPNSLTFAELSFIHQQICQATSTLLEEEPCPCPDQQLSDMERLTQRSEVLQSQIKKRLDKAKRTVVDLELRLYPEMKRMRKLRQALVQLQNESAAANIGRDQIYI